MANSSPIHLHQRMQEADGEEEQSRPFQLPDGGQLTLRRPIYNEETFHEIFPRESSSKSAKDKIRKVFNPNRCSLKNFKTFLFQFIPILHWLPRYKFKTYLLEDVVAGFTVGVLRIPHGMAHAVLATLSPVYGLYTNIFPQLIYTVFGTSKHISIGTMAVISIMVGDAVEKAYQSLYGGENDVPPIDEARERAKIASTLALMVGLIQLVMGFLRIGIITNYLPEPLVRGFTTGAACHVFCSQFNHLFGIELTRHTGAFSLIRTYIPFFPNLGMSNPTTLIVSFISLVILVSVKEIQDLIRDRFKWQLPVEMLVVILGTLFSYIFNFKEKDVLTVGTIPNGLPAPYIPSFTYASTLFSDAIVLSIVSYALVISLANIFAKKHKYEVNANQELYAFGTAQILSSTFYCYPSTSSLSRTLVRDIAGGKSMIAGAVSTILVILVVLLLGRFLSPLPACSLAAIIVVALRGMFQQVVDIKKLWTYSRIDMTIWLITFVSTVLLGLDFGLAIGVGFSVFSVVLRSQWPQCCSLGQFGKTGLYGDLKKFPDAKSIPGIKIFRIQSPLFFANASFIKNLLRVPTPNKTKKTTEIQQPAGNGRTHHDNQYVSLELQEQNEQREDNTCLSMAPPDIPVHTIILDMSGVSFVDTVALNTLETICQDYLALGVKVYLAECRSNVQAMIFKSGLLKSIKLDHIFLSVHDAVLAVQNSSIQVEPLDEGRPSDDKEQAEEEAEENC